jgi:hypothetical protein
MDAEADQDPVPDVKRQPEAIRIDVSNFTRRGADRDEWLKNDILIEELMKSRTVILTSSWTTIQNWSTKGEPHIAVPIDRNGRPIVYAPEKPAEIVEWFPQLEELKFELDINGGAMYKLDVEPCSKNVQALIDRVVTQIRDLWVDFIEARCHEAGRQRPEVFVHLVRLCLCCGHQCHAERTEDSEASLDVREGPSSESAATETTPDDGFDDAPDQVEQVLVSVSGPRGQSPLVLGEGCDAAHRSDQASHPGDVSRSLSLTELQSSVQRPRLDRQLTL